MMNEDDDDDGEEVILDRRDFIPQARNLSSTSGSILLGFNQFNIGIYDDSNKLSKEKTIILVVTCISIGMFSGLLGPTFLFLAQNMSTELPSIVWLIPVKAIGFLLGTYLSSYLYTWFNVCCLLSLSCLSVSFGVCSLPFIIDLTTLYLTSFILGISLGLSYNGIDALYNYLWARSSIRWLHILFALGAILSTLMLIPATISDENNIPSVTNMSRPHRTILNDTILLEQSTSKSICLNSYCCYHENNRTNIFICSENTENQTIDCQNVLSSCQSSIANICNINKTDIHCRIDQICSNETKLNCSIILTTSMMIIQSTVSNTHSITTTYYAKPAMAISDNDDLSKNLFYRKIILFFHSITYIHFVYFFLALIFFLLGIFYSILAIRGEGMNSNLIINLNPLSLIYLKPSQITNNQTSSFQFVFLIIFFYFIFSSIETSCHYLTYLFGRELKLSERKSLVLQICYLFGRLIDILINYIWLLNIKKQTNFISIKFLIAFRLIILFLICLINSFQQILNLLFFSIGFFLTSISSLIFYWIERDLNLNEIFLRKILFTIIISESIFPIILFYKLQYFLQVYILSALCLLIILFLVILYSSQKLQVNRLYRLVPTAIEMESQENSDNEISNNSKLH